MKMNELFILMKNENYSTNNLNKYLMNSFKYIFEHPWKKNKYIITKNKDFHNLALEECNKAKDGSCPYTTCVINIDNKKRLIIANVFPDNDPIAHKIIEWIYNNYKENIEKIYDDYFKDYTTEIRNKGIEVLF